MCSSRQPCLLLRPWLALPWLLLRAGPANLLEAQWKDPHLSPILTKKTQELERTSTSAAFSEEAFAAILAKQLD